ncbi:MAG: hypothetical protein ACK4RK_05765 [Gemmataceae bacterium]
MNDQVRQPLRELIATYGANVCNMPRSCELFVRQHCGQFAAETQLLIQALNNGTVAKLRSATAGPAWDATCAALAAELTDNTGMSADEARWAIDCWGIALGKHPDAMAIQAQVPTSAAASQVSWNSAPPELQTPDAGVVISLTGLVAIGGGMGGALGGLLITSPLLVLIGADWGGEFTKQETQAISMGSIFIMLLMAVIAGGGGAIGSAGGWLLSKGSHKPWTGFWWALCGAFTTAAIMGFLCSVFGLFLGGLIGGFSGAVGGALKG